jgi:hypothetical protein
MNEVARTLLDIWQSTVPQSTRRRLYTLRRGWHPWPLIKNVMALLFDRNLRLKSERLCALKGKYTGQRCFVMGNGPSINRMDLSLLEGEHVWGLNKCYLLFPRISWRPSFFVAVDRRVVPDSAGEINRVTAALPQTTFFFPARFRSEWILRSAPNVYWYNEVDSDERHLPFGMFTLDPASWVSTVGTVSIAALQLAVYLGFNPIYLIGCDTSYRVQPTVNEDGGDWRKLVSTQDDDPNHFDPRYFGKGSKWHDPQVNRMFFHYEQVKSACDSFGVHVYNATIGGKLEVFPRVNYSELF